MQANHIGSEDRSKGELVAVWGRSLDALEAWSGTEAATVRELERRVVVEGPWS